ncbi:MAG: M20/M25/M40 family metallo-hydrolase [Planctomycetota bacterium]|nr:M20/M25/M40 family metallo-hydrolase [Planctomycetota bacterium]
MASLLNLLHSRIAPRRDEMIADLARYVAIPTGCNHTPGLDTFRAMLVARLAALGAVAETIPGDPRPDWLSERADPAERPFSPPPTVVCRRPVAGRPRILLAGHIDTVFDPRGGFVSMSLAPDGKKAVGPGVVDMKGGILIALVALETLRDVGAEISWSFILNSDEETGSYASDRALRAEAARHDFGLALEPALPDGGLAVERKGSGQFLIETFGKSAHAGRDFEKGVSAVYALARTLVRVEALSDPATGLTVNVGPLRGGPATNIVPDSAAAWGNVRFVDDSAGRRVESALRALESMDSTDDAHWDRARLTSLPAVRVRTSMARPAKPLTPRTEALALQARAVAQELGQSLPFGSSGGVCDGNNLQAAGLPTIDTLGVRGGGLHTTQEWIELDSLAERAALLAGLMARLSGLA